MPDKKDSTKPEISFLPPLKMILSFFDKETRQREKEKTAADKKEKYEEKVVKLIEKLSEPEKKD
jgi:hypothetical protein